ncbi:achaete-scute homolog 1b-like [Mytilus californianus]|uniref:achaete-scute homolog 1b-like n=1 Tax=Mytilus californianus TaxID=6549 RepID=UPI002246C7F4|nr:achaete-scute homolog 1b-like [Mytilus californianus]
MEGEGMMHVFSGMTSIDGNIFQTFLTERPSCMYSSSPESSPEYFHQPKYSKDVLCKRRLDFNHNNENYLGLNQKPTTGGVARRNERERNRVKLINMTFSTLRDHIPSDCKIGKSKKMSKVDTLKAAIDYIRHLQDLVDEHDAVSAVLDKNYVPKQCTVPISPSVHSPSPSSCSEAQELSNEDEELLDFTTWF